MKSILTLYYQAIIKRLIHPALTYSQHRFKIAGFHRNKIAGSGKKLEVDDSYLQPVFHPV